MRAHGTDDLNFNSACRGTATSDLTRDLVYSADIFPMGPNPEPPIKNILTFKFLRSVISISRNDNHCGGSRRQSYGRGRGKGL